MDWLLCRVNGGYGRSAASSAISGATYDPALYANIRLTDPGQLQRIFHKTGGFAGGQVGYNLQRDRFVYGVEADLQRAGVDGASTTVASD